MRKSESVCSFCLARRNVTDPVCERTRSQDGPQEKIGMAPFVPKGTRQMPGQLSWPLRNGCRKKCSSEGIWTMLCCKYQSSLFDLFLDIIPDYRIIDILFEMIESLSSPFRRSLDQFHFQGLGISGWGIWFFYGGYWCMVFGLVFFHAGLGVGLLVVPSCGS